MRGGGRMRPDKWMNNSEDYYLFALIHLSPPLTSHLIGCNELKSRRVRSPYLTTVLLLLQLDKGGWKNKGRGAKKCNNYRRRYGFLLSRWDLEYVYWMKSVQQSVHLWSQNPKVWQQGWSGASSRLSTFQTFFFHFREVMHCAIVSLWLTPGLQMRLTRWRSCCNNVACLCGWWWSLQGFSRARSAPFFVCVCSALDSVWQLRTT